MDRNEIINECNKGELITFLENDNNKKVIELFNEEGINFLEKSERKIDIINYVLTYSKYKNEVLKNGAFLEVMLNTNINWFYATLGTLDKEAYDAIINKAVSMNLNNSDIAELFSYFNIDYKLNKLDNWNYSNDLLYKIIKTDEPVVINKILNSFNIDLASPSINLGQLFETAKNSSSIFKKNTDNKEITIPSNLITKEVLDKMWNDNNIYSVRNIINNAMYFMDTSIFDSYVKEKEESIINNGNLLIEPFNTLYNTLKEYKEMDYKLSNDMLNDEEEWEISRRKFLKTLNNFLDKNIYIEQSKINVRDDINDIYNYLKGLSDNYLSNYIIDYHFEENLHNVMIDINELLQFYYRGNITIDKDRIDLYERIANIDYLSNEEKIMLHNEMKNYNIMEQFYDDMAYARDIVAESIKEYSLSSDTIKKYKDDKLSNKYGVDVYNVDGNPFFGIVKSGTHREDNLPTGHSYSLIGDGALGTFDNPSNNSTFLYDSNDLNKEQIVHTFPFDSFTMYRPFNTDFKATDRVNMLLTADELVNKTMHYNELLILEKGRTITDMDDKIPKLKKIALYCIDEISEHAIDVAKENNVGIILIDSKKYMREKDIENSWYADDKYFNGINEIEKYEGRRL